MAASAMYDTGEYARNRKAILADNPACAIAGPNCSGRATTADHVVAIALGGTNDMHNLRPACAECNGHLGGKLGRARQLATRPSDGFLGPSVDAPSPASGSPSRRPMADESRRSQAIAEDVPRLGRIEPRLLSATTGDGSYGPQIAAWAERHQRWPLMEWNTRVLDALFATDHGRLVHSRGLITVGRQNSKTTLGLAVLGWWLDELADLRGEPQTGILMSHDLKLSEVSFMRVREMLDHRVIRTSSSYGRQTLTMNNRSTLHVAASNVNAGHGLSVDIALADELWRVPPEAVDHGLAPAQRARPQHLLLGLSTAGDEASSLLRSWRERGVTQVEANTPGSFFFSEHSPPPGADYTQPWTWAFANPALGVSIEPEQLVDEFNAPNRAAFLRATCNLWVAAEESWLAPGQWDRARARKMPEPVGGVVAAEIATGGDRFVATRAWVFNGITYVMPLVVTEFEDRLWAEIEDVYGEIDHLLVTPPLAARVPPAWRKVSTVGIRELARAVPVIRSMLAAGNVGHDGSSMLAEHVGRAIASRSAGLSTAASGPIELARTMVWSVSAASRPTYSRKPALGVARS